MKDNQPAVIGAISASEFINNYLYLNRNSPYNRRYTIENALRELAQRNGGQFTVADSNPNSRFPMPESNSYELPFG